MDLNSFEILGFSDGDGAKASLTSIRGHRKVLALLHHSSPSNPEKLYPFLVREPHRDCNKLYTGIRGLPTGQWTPVEALEDFGVYQDDFLQNEQKEMLSEWPETLKETCKLFTGSFWITSNTCDEEILENCKIVFAVIYRDSSMQVKCHCLCMKMKSFTSELKLNEFCNDRIALRFREEIMCDNINIMAIVPLIEPKRVVHKSKQVIFIG